MVYGSRVHVTATDGCGDQDPENARRATHGLPPISPAESGFGVSDDELRLIARKGRMTVRELEIKAGAAQIGLDIGRNILKSVEDELEARNAARRSRMDAVLAKR